MHFRYFLILCLALVLKAAAIIAVIFYSGIGLGPDEAQYWTWSQALDWGYYSKPPGIAWEIWLGTSLFGHTPLGVRSMALLIGTLIPLLVYKLAKNCRLSPEGCFWAAILMAFTPLGILSSLLAITDGGMVLFWTAACTYMARKIMSRSLPNYLLLGLLIGAGAIFKWPIYTLWVFIFGSWFYFPYLRSWKIGLGITLSLLALLPSLYWNATHEWATFRHVSATVSGGHGKPPTGALFAGNMWEFTGSQAALVSPILFVLLVIAFWTIFRKNRNVPAGVLFCTGLSAVILCLGILASIFMKIQGNWAIFVYPTAFVGLSWFACEYAWKTKKWLIAGVALSVILCSIVFAIPKIQSENLLEKYPISYKINPFRHNVGWNSLDPLLLQVGYDPSNDFLIADKYQTVSELSFYAPQQKLAYFLNLQGSRKNQFSFWPGLDSIPEKKRGFFIIVENAPQLFNTQEELIEKYQKELSGYFNHVRFVGVYPLFFAYEKMVKGALIFECLGYNGNSPPETELY